MERNCLRSSCSEWRDVSVAAKTTFAMLLSLGNMAVPMLIFAPLALQAGVAQADALLPQSKIRVSLVQWVPTKGAYEPWEAISGEYTISDMGTVSMPVLGSVAIGDHDNAGLAADIAERLRTKLGLVSAPEATVDIISYPPVYVVGDVMRPGELPYRAGLTVIQAFATSGGEVRSDSVGGSLQVTRLLGEIRASDDAILRSTASSARLEAEMSDATELRFPQADSEPNPFATAIFDQEKTIFSARRRAMEQQTRSLTELRDLLEKEISSLEEKLTNVEANIKSSEAKLATVDQLVTRGIATASRQMDTERDLRNDQGERLDLETAVMRARQEFSKASRDLQGLSDERRSQAAIDLQQERAVMAQERLKRETNQRLLLETLSANPSLANPDGKPRVTFEVLRREGGKLNNFPATDTTILMPGDVIKVTMNRAQGAIATQTKTAGAEVLAAPLPQASQ